MKRLIPSTPSRYWRSMDSTQKARSTNWKPSTEASKAPRRPREMTKVAVLTARAPHRQSMARVRRGVGPGRPASPGSASRRVIGVSRIRSASPANGAQIVRVSQGNSLSI